MGKDFEGWDDGEMNTEEAAYYLDIQNRISKKLIEVANWGRGIFKNAPSPT